MTTLIAVSIGPYIGRTSDDGGESQAADDEIRENISFKLSKETAFVPRITIDRRRLRKTEHSFMTTSDAIQSNEPTREFILAPDLGAWLNRRNLVMLVLEIVQKMDEARLLEPGSAKGERRSEWQTHLTLLTYCYATGIYGSERIARQTAVEETLRYLCANHLPDGAALRQFRRQNRDAIEKCLEKVSLVVWKTRFGNWSRRQGDVVAGVPQVSGCRLDPSFQSQIRLEVRDRVDRAERQDNAGLAATSSRQATFA